MKEHFQDYGVRKWAGDDLIELQSEPLAALQGLVEPYAPCIIQGCIPVRNDDGSSYKVSAGLVALRGIDTNNVSFAKIVKVEELAATSLPVYLSLKKETESRVYSDSKSKPIAYHYKAEVSTVPPQEGEYLKITEIGSPRLVDTLGITDKLDRVGGEAKDTVVTFTDTPDRKPLASGMKLGELVSLIKKWFSDLKTLAFKDKVAEKDLEATLSTKLNNKVDKVDGKGLSVNDFTDALKDKLNDIDNNANNYIHPTESGYKHIPAGGQAWQFLSYANSPGTAQWVHPHVVSAERNGFMSVADKAKLDGIAANANNYIHPTTAGNKHIPSGGSSGQYLKYSASGTAVWSKPTAAEVGAAATSHSHNYLPLEGGTITGNLRLKGSGNYGNKLNFGDGDYVYLHEETDDNLTIKAKEVKVSGNLNATGQIKENGTRVYSPNNKPTAATIGAAASSHSHSNASISSSGFMSTSDKSNLNALWGMKLIHVSTVGVSTTGTVNPSFNRSISGVTVSFKCLSDSGGDYVEVKTGFNGVSFTRVIVMVTGESNAPAFIDGNSGNGNFRMRLRHGTNDATLGGGFNVALFGVQ